MKNKEDFHYDFIRYEDEEGKKISDKKIMFHKGPLFKCWIVGGNRFQIMKVN